MYERGRVRALSRSCTQCNIFFTGFGQVITRRNVLPEPAVVECAYVRRKRINNALQIGKGHSHTRTLNIWVHTDIHIYVIKHVYIIYCTTIVYIIIIYVYIRSFVNATKFVVRIYTLYNNNMQVHSTRVYYRTHIRICTRLSRILFKLTMNLYTKL